MSKYTDEDRVRILAESRAALERTAAVKQDLERRLANPPIIREWHNDVVRKEITEAEAKRKQRAFDSAAMQHSIERNLVAWVRGIVDQAIADERERMIEQLLPEVVVQLREEFKAEAKAAIERAFENGAGEVRADMNALRAAIEKLAATNSATVITLPRLRGVDSKLN
jgi:hypothetical protein